MAKKIVIQRKGQTMKEGTIGRWLKNSGDSVRAGEAIYELEYDKATCEVEAPVDGILRIIEKEGATLPVGTVVAEILGEDEADASGIQSNIAAGQEKIEDTQKGDIQSAGKYAVSASAKRLIRQNNLEAAYIVPANGRRIMRDDVVAFMNTKDVNAKRIKATPYARKVAAMNGVRLEDVLSEIQTDKIAAADVENYMQNHSGTKEGNSLSKEEAEATVSEEKRVSMSTMRRVISQNMTQSYFSIPAVTYFMEADFTEALKLRKELNEEYEREGLKVSVNDLLLKAAAVALKRCPYMNVSMDDNDIVYHNSIHIGMAVSVPGGLVVPVLRNVGEKPLDKVAKDAKEMIEKAMSGTLTGDEMSGGTFTVTNLGGKGVDAFTPIINGNQAAILGVGKVQEKAVVINGEIKIRSMITLSLTADHRLIDGAPAADFLSTLKRIIEKPILMLIS